MKQLIALFLIFFSIQSFAVTVTSTSSISVLDSTFVTLNVTLDDIDKRSRVKCVIYNKDGVAVGKGVYWINGVGTVEIKIASNSGAKEYKCKDIGAFD